MNLTEIRREQLRFDRWLRFAELLNVDVGDLEELINEALPLATRLDSRGAEAFRMYYGLKEAELAELKTISEKLDLKLSTARFAVFSFASLVEETIRAIRNEQKFSGRYALWPTEDFFTFARGLECGVNSRTAGRVRAVASKQCERFPLLGDFCQLSGSEIMRLPKSGVGTVGAMRTMLAPVGLSFGMEPMRIKRAA